MKLNALSPDWANAIILRKSAVRDIAIKVVDLMLKYGFHRPSGVENNVASNSPPLHNCVTIRPVYVINYVTYGLAG